MDLVTLEAQWDWAPLCFRLQKGWDIVNVWPLAHSTGPFTLKNLTITSHNGLIHKLISITNMLQRGKDNLWIIEVFNVYFALANTHFSANQIKFINISAANKHKVCQINNRHSFIMTILEDTLGNFIASCFLSTNARVLLSFITRNNLSWNHFKLWILFYNSYDIKLSFINLSKYIWIGKLNINEICKYLQCKWNEIDRH